MQNTHLQLSRTVNQDQDPSLVTEELNNMESLTTTEDLPEARKDLPEARKDLETTEISLQTEGTRAKHHRGILLTIPDRRKDQTQQTEAAIVPEVRHTHATARGDPHTVTGVDQTIPNTEHCKHTVLSQRAREEMNPCRFRVYTEAKAQEPLQASRNTTSSLVKDMKSMQTGRHAATAYDATVPSIEQKTALFTEKAAAPPARCVYIFGTAHNYVIGMNSMESLKIKKN